MKADTYWQRTWALIPMVLSVVMVLDGIAFTMGLVILVMGITLSIRNWRALSARRRD